MQRKAFTLVEAIVLIVILAIIAAFLFPSIVPDDRGKHRSSCLSNLKQISLGLLQYTQDYDEKFPPAKNAVGGWADLVFPYVKSTQIFQCPNDRSGAGKTSDYFFNTRLLGVSMEKLAAPELTISLGDGLLNQPFDANLSQLPATWLQDSSSPAHRHLDGANYAFADGHVKWYKPEKITLDKPDKNNPTFLLGSIQP